MGLEILYLIIFLQGIGILVSKVILPKKYSKPIKMIREVIPVGPNICTITVKTRIPIVF